mmetsp:Transcript_106885/g.147937  ORF Transcript_106885/g.147937 Transcript_106885/m.147937 type:complete len:187 (+) Transcript_106885:188-748(+)
MNKIEPELLDYVESSEFPFKMMDQFKKLDISGKELKGIGGGDNPISTIENGAIYYELARIDASIATFFLVHGCLGQYTVYKLGNEAQKKKILPESTKLEKIMAYGLTEPDRGSDAGSLETTAKKVKGGYVLNGTKRWIGNGTFCDYTVIWAKNEAEQGKVQCFVVEKGMQGLSTSKIEHKYALRIV